MMGDVMVDDDIAMATQPPDPPPPPQAPAQDDEPPPPPPMTNDDDPTVVGMEQVMVVQGNDGTMSVMDTTTTMDGVVGNEAIAAAAAAAAAADVDPQHQEHNEQPQQQHLHHNVVDPQQPPDHHPHQHHGVVGVVGVVDNNNTTTPTSTSTTTGVVGVGDVELDPTHNLPAQKRRRLGGKKGSRPWNDMLYELLKYRSNHGNVMVPFKSGGDLGKWVAAQRAQYMALQKSLTQKLVDDPHNPQQQQQQWQHNGGGGTVHHHHHHNSNNAQHHDDGPQRLTQDRMKVLSSIGFVWDVVQADNDARWKRRFEELKDYKAIHGHCNVPQSTDLGKWVKMQRENKHEADLKRAGTTPIRKKPKPCLSQERIERLESIGFQWRVAKPAVGWDRRFQQLLEYRNQHGDCNVPQSYPPDKPFGRWVMKQRCQHSLKLRQEKSQLTDDREKKLNEIGFSWVAPGFSKKTVTMPGDEEEAQEVQQQAVAHQAQQEQLNASEVAAAVLGVPQVSVPPDEYNAAMSWTV